MQRRDGLGADATGEGQLALESVDASDAESRGLVGRFVGVSLEVADIFATHKFLAARGGVCRSTREAGLGAASAHLRDPDGNILTLVGDSN
jgi:lactoylglutathione lyase